MVLSKGIRFFSAEHDVSDAQKIAERVVLLNSQNEKLDHWEIYSSYIILVFVLTEGYRKIAENELPVVTVQDLKSFVEAYKDVKQILLTRSMLFLPLDTFKEIKDVIRNIAETKEMEFKSIMERLNEVLDDPCLMV